jgi:hypothetical protein
MGGRPFTSKTLVLRYNGKSITRVPDLGTIGSEETVMKCKTKSTNMGTRERCLVEDSFVETLDTQQQRPEALSNLQVDETKASTASGQDDVSGVNKAKEQDDLMESVKVFIRNIDINNL